VIPQGGGAATVVVPAGGPSYDSNALWMDATMSNLYVTEGANSPQVLKIPIVNCVLQTASETPIPIGNLGSVSYYWSAGAVAADAAGDVFIATNADCCGQGNELVEEYAGYGSGTTLLVNLPSNITSMAVDAANNIYYVSGGAVFELPFVSGAYAANPVPFGSGYSTWVVGVTLDSAGNLYITDGGTTKPIVSSAIYEIPYEGASGLNQNDQFMVASGIPVTSPVAFDSAGNFYFTDVNYSGTVSYANSLTYIYELTRDSANLGPEAVASTATGTLNVVFNAPVTPATIGFVTNNGVFASATGSTCAANTAYSAGSSCAVNVNFTPAVPGTAAGALVLADSTGTALAAVNLYGTGLGAGLTFNPGIPNSIGSGLKTPMSVALDVAGDLFIADSGASKVWEVPTGNGTPVAIGKGLSAPEGVAADGVGNVYIADTGNNQIVMVPVVNGALNSSAQITLVSGSTSIAGSTLNSPAGLSTDMQGNLYIADQGNNRVVFLPQTDDWNVSQALTLGSGFSGPLATTVAASGLIYIADSGNGKVYSIAYPGAGVPLTVAATGLSNPSALGTDAAGDLFVVDQGNMRVVRIPNVSGSLATGSYTNVGFGIANPYGLAVDPAGNLYVSDNVNAAAYMVARTVSTLPFGNLNPGDTSSPASVQVESSGNQALTLGTPYFVAAGDTSAYTLENSEANACANGGSVAVGTNCFVEAIFAPPTGGTFTDTLTLSSNATNASAPAVTFTGTGEEVKATTTTLAITSPTGTPYYGEAIALSASVTASVGTPTGSVALMVDGSQVATSTLNNGTAAFSLNNGLTGGSHALQAIYQGATTPTIVYAGSDSPIDTINVSQVTTATALSFTPLYNNPLSQPAGTALTLTAAVSSTFAGIPTGAVTFTITNSGSTTVTAPATLTPVGGGVFQATYTYTPPAPANGVAFNVVSVAASYVGDENFSGSSTGTQSFDVSPASGSVVLTPSSTSVSSGGIPNGTITFANTSYGGWQGVVGYQCLASTLPAHTICLFSPGQASVMASTPTTPYPTATTQLTVVVNNPPNSPVQSTMLWWLGGLTGLFLFWTRRRLVRGAWGTVAMSIGMALLLVSASGLMACNSGVQSVTPRGTSTITVVANIDPYVTPMVNPPKTQPCGAEGPCSQQTFQISVTVQ
jgi:hypothetical protein